MARPTSVPAELRSPSLAASQAYVARDGQARIATAICFRRRECADVAAASRRIRPRDDPKVAGGVRARPATKRRRAFFGKYLAERSRVRTTWFPPRGAPPRAPLV